MKKFQNIMTRIVVVHKDQVEGYGYQLYRKTSNI